MKVMMLQLYHCIVPFVEFYDHAYKQSQLQTFFQNDPAIMNNNMFAT